MIWISASKALPFTFTIFVVSTSLKGLFVVPSVSHESTSSLKDSFLAFKARDFLSTFALTISESFLMIISWTLRFPMNSSRNSDVKRRREEERINHSKQDQDVAIPLVAIKEYYYRHVSKSDNVNGEASTSQPKEKKEPFAPQPNNKGKDMSNLQEINIVSLQNLFDALKERDKFFEVNNETWKASDDVGSIMDDSDSEEVKNVFVEDNGKPMDCLVDDARKKVEDPPKKTPRNWYLIG
ncbi:hypothetical protein Tco_0964639 [Tanacetum coccineum]